MKNHLIFSENSVKKYFHSKIACQKEKELLSLLAGKGLCPDIISADTDHIEMSFINGITLADALDKCDNIPYIFEKLVLWIMEFNTITENIVLDDINLKNFIWCETDDKIYGIDFERWHRGDNTRNFAAIAAMVMSAKAENKSSLYNHIVEYTLSVCNIDRNLLADKINIEIEKINLRRNAMPLIRKSDCVIIAGGKSSRMGFPKGLLLLNDFTFTDHIIYNTSVFDRQFISANTELYNGFNCNIIADKQKDKGPLGALQACLCACESEYVFFIPCDMPFISEETVFNLYNRLDKNSDAVVFKANGKVFPTVGIYRKTVLNAVENQLESGNYRMMELLDKINTQFIDAPYPQQFININTPDDYKNI